MNYPTTYLPQPEPDYVQCLDELNAARLTFQAVTYAFIEDAMETLVHFEPTSRVQEYGDVINDCFRRNNVSVTRESLLHLLDIALEKAPLLSEMVTLNIQGYMFCKGNDAVPEANKNQFSLETIEDLSTEYAAMIKSIDALKKNLQSLA